MNIGYIEEVREKAMALAVKVAEITIPYEYRTFDRIECLAQNIERYLKEGTHNG